MKKIYSAFIILAVGLLGLFGLLAGSEGGKPSEGKELWAFAYFGEDDFFFKPSDMDFDAAGSLIYIADSGNDRILAFDANGRLVRIIGKKGQGPGEFAGPTGLFVMKDSRLAVADYENNRIQIFNSEGEFEKVINTREVRVADLVVIGEEIYTIPTFGQSGYRLNMGSKENTQPLVNVLDFEGNLVRTLTSDAFPEAQPFIRAIKHRVSITLAPDGNLFLPYFAINKVLVLDPSGNRVDEFKRDLPFEPLFPQLLQQRSSGGVIQMSAKTDMVSQSAQFGGDGNLYILTYGESFDDLIKKREDPESMPPFPMQLDVLDPKSHRRLRSIKVDDSIKAFALPGDSRLAYIHEDAEGELVFKCVEIGK